MVITYKKMATPLVPNTIMRKMLIDGVVHAYTMRPAAGYVLHDCAADAEEYNEFTQEPTGRIIFRYATEQCSCGANYDFTPATVTDENGVNHTAYGARQFFARAQGEVPENQIYGGGDNNQ